MSASMVRPTAVPMKEPLKLFTVPIFFLKNVCSLLHLAISREKKSLVTCHLPFVAYDGDGHGSGATIFL
jgi:hypothetical protein